MKTQLDRQQSQHLIYLGVPKEKASAYAYVESHQYRGGIELPPIQIPIFTLTDLLSILPKEIEGENYVEYLRIGFTEDRKWRCHYTCYEDYFYGIELIDSLYELCVWTIENKFI